ncbi:MAG: tRNA (adenosine(37)-N6)-threonylcarbamoyltransferase complex dimerization subunit type 1 TsaB [Bacteroidota bacterium]
MLTLGIETATDVCSVALLDGDALLAEASLRLPRQHAARLVPLVRDVLAHTGRAATDLDLVAVSEGPGSYTGLRIGVSTAKGLAIAADARLVGVPSLEALACQAAPLAQPGDRIAVAFPSRRGEVYAAGFVVSPEHDIASLPGAGPTAIVLDEAAAWWPDSDAAATTWLLGPAAPQLGAALARPLTRLLDAARFAPSAALVARLGRERAYDAHGDAWRTEDVASFEPSYLKEFVAGKPRPLF